MAIVKAKGKKADYIIEFGHHFWGHRPKTKLYEKADASIFEALMERKGRTEVEYANALKTGFRKRYSKLFADAKRNDKSVWHGDVVYVDHASKKGLDLIANCSPALLSYFICLLITRKLKKKGKLSRRKLFRELQEYWIPLGVGFLTTGTLHGWVAVIKKGEMPKPLLDLGIKYGDIVKTAEVEGRSAMIVEKAESFIASYLAKRLGRRPTIYIWMGLGHLSLPKLIEEPEYRRGILREFSPPEKFFKTPATNCIEFEYRNRKEQLHIHKRAISFPKVERREIPRARKFNRRELFKRGLRRTLRV